jgi:hypothetical protein
MIFVTIFERALKGALKSTWLSNMVKNPWQGLVRALPGVFDHISLP